jgi:hypothetical protein
MVQARNPHQIIVLQAQYKIFDKLCIAYRRSRQDPAFAIRAEDVRRELAIGENVFAEALDGFIDASGKRIVEVFDRNGERYLSLGDSAKFNLSD